MHEIHVTYYQKCWNDLKESISLSGKLLNLTNLLSYKSYWRILTVCWLQMLEKKHLPTADHWFRLVWMTILKLLRYLSNMDFIWGNSDDLSSSTCQHCLQVSISRNLVCDRGAYEWWGLQTSHPASHVQTLLHHGLLYYCPGKIIHQSSILKKQFKYHQTWDVEIFLWHIILPFVEAWINRPTRSWFSSRSKLFCPLRMQRPNPAFIFTDERGQRDVT